MLRGAVLLIALPLGAQDLPRQALEILQQNCAQCHGESMSMSGLSLASREGALKGGNRGAAILPGNAQGSRIFRAVSHTEAPHMPPGRTLPPEAVNVIRRWIEAGAVWPRNPQPAAASKWWSFQKPVPPAVPSATPWVRTEVDAFVARKLVEQGLRPAGEASRSDLIRRATFDLHGLPPTADEVRAFVADSAPDAYEKLIDRLLASPRYGEKQARHWLDLVRYADTAGFELDVYNNTAWRYRDYVIEVFNSDKPYAEFIKEQIAGDEYWPEDPRRHIGTGLYCVGPNRDLFLDQTDINRVEVLTDYTDTTAAVFQGLTAGCARCHDHKFDPISQRDYYGLQAIFVPAVKTDLGPKTILGFKAAEWQREFKMREIGDRIKALQSRCRGEIAKTRTPASNGKRSVTDEEIRACMNAHEAAQLRDAEKRLVAMTASLGVSPYFCGLKEYSPRGGYALLPARGSTPATPVGPATFPVLGGAPIEDAEVTAASTGRRRALAEFLISPDNPLTARVMVNRLWQGHFGRGIVATPSDFGSRGAPPSNQNLLDWLATEFVRRNWSMKQMHKLIMTSSVYRQSADASPQSRERDPDNLYLSHFTRRRLESDEIRDAVLLASGSLNLKMGGRPVVPPLNPDELSELSGPPEDGWFVTADPNEQNRRSIYLFVRRSFRMPMMAVFDTPETMFSCPRRESSTTAPQSLTLINGDFVVARAREMAARLARENAGDDALIRAAWNRVLARDPSSEELRAAQKLLQRQNVLLGSRDSAAAELCRGLFNLNSFLFVD